MEEIRKLASIECGHEAAKFFSFPKGFRNLNHGMCRVNIFQVVVQGDMLISTKAPLVHTQNPSDRFSGSSKTEQKQDQTTSFAMNTLNASMNREKLSQNT